MTYITRRQLAQYAAAELLSGNDRVVQQLAAYLVAERRTKEAESLVRDIEDALAQQGLVVADVTSTYELDTATRAAIATLLQQHTGSPNVHLKESVDDTLLGGVLIRTPGEVFDGTIRRKINELKAV